MAKCKSCGAMITAKTFWGHVQKGDGCWLWTGGKDDNGYGVQCHTRTHRLSWIFTHGTIPDAKFVLHSCDTPACVNPEHLFLGTQTDNMADMNRKRRWRSRALQGSDHSNAILSDEIVREIKKLYGPPRGRGRRNCGVTQEALAKRFGVTRTVVGYVVTGDSWRHVQ